jgi:uncharacterized integral membrane protein
MTQMPNESGRVPVEPPTGRRRGGATPSRVGSLWVASVLFAVVLLLLLIFVLQNGQDAKISYFGAHGSLPQGVALLLAAVFGILLVALPGTARIIQLRIRDRRHRGAARTRPPADAGPASFGGTAPDAGTTAAPPTDSRPTDAPPADARPIQAPPRDVTPPATSPLTGNAAGANAPSTNAPTTPVASPPGPPEQPPPADPR